MTCENDEFLELLGQIREGSQDAAWELVERFSPYIVRAVRRAMNHNMRSKFSSLDFVQMVWASVFAKSNILMKAKSQEELVRILTATARYKTIDEVRRRTGGGKYSVEHEARLGGSTNDAELTLDDIAASKEPRPSEIAVAREQWEQMLEGQPCHYRRIATLRLQGETYKRIAQELDISQRTVQRVLERLLHRSVK